MSVTGYEGEDTLYLAYQRLFCGILHAEPMDREEAAAEWQRIEGCLAQPDSRTADIPGALPIPVYVRHRLTLSDPEYACMMLAVVYEMGSLGVQPLTFYHAAMLNSFLFDGDTGLESFVTSSTPFSLLWRPADASPLLTRALSLRPAVVQFLLTHTLYVSPSRSLRYYNPGEESVSETPMPVDDEALDTSLLARINRQIETDVTVLRGDRPACEAALRLFCLSHQMIAYCIESYEEDITECLLLAAVSGVVLYMDAPSEEAMRCARFFRDLLAVPVLAGCRSGAAKRSYINLETTPPVCLDDICGETLRHRLRLVCDYLAQGDAAFRRYSPACAPVYGRGVGVVFYGKSGTGKTMAAHAIARELDRPLLSACLSEIYDKYIGETEKKMEQLFHQAEEQSAILFFDEAESLFSKRTAVSDAHDKYANLSTSFLLKRMEDFNGAVILSTNLIQNMDEAFLRRMQFVIRFSLPDRAARKRYWQLFLPCFPDERLEAIAGEDLSYARIKEVVKLAAVLAWQGGGDSITPEDVGEALRMERQKTE